MTRLPRRRPVYLSDERELFEAWLDFQRATLLAKCEGLTAEQLKHQPVQSSVLSLHGLLRHLTDTELNWFCRILPDDPTRPSVFSNPAVPDTPFVPLDDADWESDVAIWRAQIEASKASAALVPLDHPGRFRDRTIELRAIYHQMLQEYARHNGHADIVRELIDGRTGV
jgi:hypothetical protein